MNPYLEKLRSIGFVSKQGTTKTKVERTPRATFETTEHWDGRQDAVVRPATVRYGARTHQTGKQKNEVAEVREMSPKEKRARYGE